MTHVIYDKDAVIRFEIEINCSLVAYPKDQIVKMDWATIYDTVEDNIRDLVRRIIKGHGSNVRDIIEYAMFNDDVKIVFRPRNSYRLPVDQGEHDLIEYYACAVFETAEALALYKLTANT